MPVADEVLVARLWEVLKDADFETTTEKMIRKTLEQEFGEDLTERKLLIREQIEKFLSEQQVSGEAEEEEQESEEGTLAKGSSFGSMLSEPMAAFLGVERMPRTQVVKHIWAYIKERSLQDPKNKKRILLDAKLQTIFTAPLTMFTMNKQLSRHVFTAEPGSAAARPKPQKRAAADKQQKGDKQQKAAKKQKREGSTSNNAFLKPMALSPELAAFVGQPAMARGQVTKFFWNYFKSHNLQDPRDRRNIVSDAPLQQLLGVKSFQAFSLARLLKEHIKGPASGEDAAAALAAAAAAATNGAGGGGQGHSDSAADGGDDSSDFEDGDS